jgi:hypothetical protein
LLFTERSIRAWCKKGDIVDVGYTKDLSVVQYFQQKVDFMGEASTGGYLLADAGVPVMWNMSN